MVRDALPLLPAVAEALLAKSVVLVADEEARKILGEDKCELAAEDDFRCVDSDSQVQACGKIRSTAELLCNIDAERSGWT